MDEVSPSDPRAGCGPERAEATQRCGEARAAREAHEAALQRGRELRRKLTAARHTLDEATETADPRRRQEAKEHARSVYHGEHAAAETERARADAAARWARAVDAINRETRKAVRAQAQARQIVAALEGELRTAEANEQSLHVTAEAAEAACLEARVRLAACEERAIAPQPAVATVPTGVGAPVAVPATVGAPMAVPAGVGAPVAATGAMTAALTGGPRGADGAAPTATARALTGGAEAPRAGELGRPAPGVPTRTDAAGASRAGAVTGAAPIGVAGAASPAGVAGGATLAGVAAGSAPAGRPDPVPQPRVGQGAPTVIEALLSGDRRWLERIASLVAETVGRPAPRIFAQLRELVESLAATAASHGYVLVDTANEFWSRLTAEESRDVLAALARLGFQAEPGEGWHADRAPVQSDLSMALAYAGLDARSLRHLPTNAQLRDLPRSISVDARVLLANEAPDLALDHVVRMLGHRADSLGPLWDDWGYIRPILLSDPRTLP